MNQTEILIRRYLPEDVDAVFDAVTESKTELTRWMPWCHEHYSREEARDWVLSRPDAWQRQEEWSFLICDEPGRVLGGCGIHRLDLKNGVGELGYWIRTSATRAGIGTEATRQVCRWAFAEAGLERIEILAAVQNLASQRVAEKAGASREGILRQRIRLHGEREDCVLFSLLKQP
jgi:ribosomal-protein-serine acetyltransferase